MILSRKIVQCDPLDRLCSSAKEVVSFKAQASMSACTTAIDTRRIGDLIRDALTDGVDGSA